MIGCYTPFSPRLIGCVDGRLSMFWGRGYTRGIQMGRDTPLRGKKRKDKKIPCGKEKALWSGPLEFLGKSCGVFGFPFFFLMTRQFWISRCTLREYPLSPPHLCTLFSLAYSGVPDAGRDGVWIPAQTNADRTSAATGKIWSIA